METTAKKLVLRSFWTGFFFHLVINLFHQDWIGKEGYLMLVDQNWWDIHWSVWVLPTIALMYFYYKTLNDADSL